MVRLRRRSRLASWACLPVVAASVVLSGCSDDEAATSPAPTSSASASGPASSAAPPSPSRTASVPAAPSSSSQAPGASAQRTGSAAPRPSRAPAAARPAAVEAPTQGQKVWAVYLAAAPRGEEARLASARDRAAAQGYTAATGDLDCDDGASAALGLPADGDFLAVSVLFRTEPEARAFVQLVGGDVAAVAPVRLYCLD